MSIGSVGSNTSAAAATAQRQLRVDQAKLAQDTRQKASVTTLKADQVRVTKDQQALVQAGSNGSNGGAATAPAAKYL